MRSERKVRRRAFLAGGASFLGLMATAEYGNAGDAGPGTVQRDPAKLRRLLDGMDAQGPRFLSVPRKDGEFLRFLVKVARAQRVLEIGTSQGFSAIWMGLALEETGGRLTTIEIDPARHDMARKNVAEAGLTQRITLVKGDAHVELAKLDGPFDFVFMDADKEGQVDYWNKLYPKKLAAGGVLAVHNAIRQANGMRDYLDLVRKHPDFDTVIVSATLDDGFCLSYRHRAP
jgi:predicted O-methyltransferase YrrM